MKKSDARGVFFDCWNTVITFQERTKNWNTQALQRHCLHPRKVDWKKVEAFSDHFFHAYYHSMDCFEIMAVQYLRLLVLNFDIALDCPVEACVHDILTNLNPSPVSGIEDFLAYLDTEKIDYAILSNTIYDDDDTMALVSRLLPNHHFRFFLGSASIGVKKPNPLFFQTGLHIAGKKASASIYIGDSFQADVIGSTQAGFRESVWLNLRRQSASVYADCPNWPKKPWVDCPSYPVLLEQFRSGVIWHS
jgi:FMN phosphatase YigB (HAD superfamily)